MNIAIVEQNDIYRESLITILNQVKDFRVVFDTSCIVHLTQNILRDIDLIILNPHNNLQCQSTIDELIDSNPNIKILTLTNDIKLSSLDSNTILRKSSKNEFEQKIRLINSNLKSSLL